MQILESLLILGGGIFCIWAAVTEQRWFFSSYRAKPFVRLFGMGGAKVFYVILGAVLCIAGLVLLGSSIV